MSSEDDSIQIATGSVIFWVTHKEEQAITEKLEALYLKRLSRLGSIQTISENKTKQKLRNEWKEKYQC